MLLALTRRLSFFPPTSSSILSLSLAPNQDSKHQADRLLHTSDDSISADPHQLGFRLHTSSRKRSRGAFIWDFCPIDLALQSSMSRFGAFTAQVAIISGFCHLKACHQVQTVPVGSGQPSSSAVKPSSSIWHRYSISLGHTSFQGLNFFEHRKLSKLFRSFTQAHLFPPSSSFTVSLPHTLHIPQICKQILRVDVCTCNLFASIFCFLFSWLKYLF